VRKLTHLMKRERCRRIESGWEGNWAQDAAAGPNRQFALGTGDVNSQSELMEAWCSQTNMGSCAGLSVLRS
jgi:hypothetical protein